MSQDNLPDNPKKTDLTSAELEKVKTYEEEGLPGIASISESQLAQAMDMYLSGKTYSFISMTLNIPKVKILYLSHKFDWYGARQEYLTEIQRTLKSRVMESKIESQDFLLQLTQLWQKKIGNKITKYLATGNEEFANKIDLKEVDRYLKTIDLLQQMASEDSGGSKDKKPSVGLNLGDGVTVKKLSDSEVEITPKQGQINNLLKHFADLRRQEDRSREQKVKEVKEIKDNKGESNDN